MSLEKLTYGLCFIIGFIGFISGFYFNIFILRYYYKSMMMIYTRELHNQYLKQIIKRERVENNESKNIMA